MLLTNFQNQFRKESEMLEIIGLTTLLCVSLIALVLSRSSLKRLSATNLELTTEYQPVLKVTAQLDELTQRYAALQDEYDDKLKLLRTNEKRMTHYFLGVGTTDTHMYSRAFKEIGAMEFESRLSKVKMELKDLVSAKEACVCEIMDTYVVNGKKSAAKKLFNREIKLRLRCLDNEFKAASAIIDWNNVNRLIQRIRDSFEDINIRGDIVKTYLKNQYLDLKIEELQLGYELNLLKREQKEAEREEVRIQREAEREEARIQAAALKAERARIAMEKLVADELSKLEEATDEQKALYELHIKELAVLKQKEQRAISLAQLTRAGYVYVISNRPSFGDGVVKIGMTRRADPNDRVKELGDASVPELFEVHAFAFTDDAPTLEKFLHNQFADERVNLVNNRKEFFHVSPEAVLTKLATFDGPYELSDLSVEI